MKTFQILMDERSLDFEYLLHQLARDEDRLREALVRTWYPFIRQYSYLLIDDVDLADFAIIETFKEAWARLDQFPTGSDFLIWIMKIHQSAVNRQLKSNSKHQAIQSWEYSEETYRIKAPYKSLQKNLRFPVVMYLLQELSISQIGGIVGTRENSVIRRISSGLEKIIGGSEAPFDIPPGDEHVRTRRVLLQPNSVLNEEKETAETHLLACEDCQHYRDFLLESNRTLKTVFGGIQHEDEEKIRVLLDFLELHPTGSRQQRRIRKMGREVVWVGIAIAAFLALGMVYNRINPLTEVQIAIQDLQNESAVEPIVESPIASATIADSRSIPTSATNQNQLMGSWDPEISSDGKWITFASDLDNLVAADTNMTQDIFQMNLESGEMFRISLSSLGTEANNASFEPSISGDGRLVVYSSWANNLTEGDSRLCVIWGTESSCPDIFLHDRETQETKLISRNLAGDPGDNFSITPRISANGEKVVYWSAASDLVPGDSRDCGVVEEASPDQISCLDIFIYDTSKHTTKRLPIGRSLESYFSITNVPMNISADGRWLVTAIRVNDQISKDLALTSSPSLYLFDLETFEASPVNMAPDGTPGNGPSFDASISADGRFIAFSSQASNLVEDDSNRNIDVFVLDRETGDVDRISEREDSSELDNDSGVTRPGRSWVGVGLDISDDGEWVIYSSAADDLSIKSRVKCDARTECQNIYLTNRLTGDSSQLNFTNIDFLPFTSLSNDGSVSIFMAHSLACPAREFCSDIYLYNRVGDRTERLGGYGSFPGLENIPGFNPGASYFLSAHSTRVTTLEFSTDNRILASGAWDGLVKLTDSSTNDLIATLEGNNQGVNDLTISPQGDLLAVAYQGNVVYLWKLPQNNILGILPGYPDVRAVDFSPTAEILAMGGDGGVWLWHIQDEILERHFELPNETIRSVDYSSDGSQIAAAGNEGIIHVWDAKSGKLQYRLGGHTDKINELKFSPNGRFLASASNDGKVNVWAVTLPDGSISQPQLFFSFEHEDWATTIDFSPDSLHLLSGSFDSTVALWDLADPRLIELLFDLQSNQVMSVNISPDGSKLAAGTVGGEVHFWEDPIDY